MFSGMIFWFLYLLFLHNVAKKFDLLLDRLFARSPACLPACLKENHHQQLCSIKSNNKNAEAIFLLYVDVTKQRAEKENHDRSYNVQPHVLVRISTFCKRSFQFQFLFRFVCWYFVCFRRSSEFLQPNVGCSYCCCCCLCFI